jgi:Tfp pilus assembly protein PilO
VTRNIRTLIGVALIAGAGFGYWHFLLGPKRAQVDRLAAQKQAAEAQIASAEATLATYQKSRDAYDANYVDVVRLGKAVPADDDVRSLMLQLDTTASRSGVDFSGVQLGGTSASPAATGAGAASAKLPPGAVQIGSAGFSAMPFSFDFHGTYSGLQNFLGRIERLVTIKDDKIRVNGRLLRLESFQISPDSDEGFPVLDAQIMASSYLAPAQSGLKGAAAAAPAASTAASTTTSTPTTTEVAG